MRNESIVIERRQVFLLFFSSVIIMILVFGVGVLLGKRLSAVVVNCDNPQQVISKNEKVEEKSSVAFASVTNDGGVKGGEGKAANVQDKVVEKVEPADTEKRSSKKGAAIIKPQEKAEAAQKRKEAEKTREKAEKGKIVAKAKEVKKSSEVIDAKFTLQVGAFPERAQALKVSADLERKGYDSWIQRVKSKDKDIFRVRIGRFPTRQEAEKFKQQFDKKERRSSFITPIE